jgi:hypothetical protein
MGPRNRLIRVSTADRPAGGVTPPAGLRDFRPSARRRVVLGSLAVAAIIVLVGVSPWQQTSTPAQATSPLANDPSVANNAAAPRSSSAAAPTFLKPSAPPSMGAGRPPTSALWFVIHVRPGHTVRRPAPGLLLGARDPEGQPVSVSAHGPAAHGRVTVNANGAVRYRPDAGFVGEDAFNFTISDGIMTTTKTAMVVVDGTSPRLLDRAPAPGAIIERAPAPGVIDVAHGLTLTLTFDEEVTFPSLHVADALFVTDLTTGVRLRAGQSGVDGPTVHATWDGAYPNHRYQVTVTRHIRDRAGNPFAGASWTFTVRSRT